MYLIATFKQMCSTNTSQSSTKIFHCSADTFSIKFLVSSVFIILITNAKDFSITICYPILGNLAYCHMLHFQKNATYTDLKYLKAP